jgi:high-affinity Fe2+/Pb2+ permease
MSPRSGALSEQAFQSARVAVATAILAPAHLPPVLIVAHLLFGAEPPSWVMAMILFGWCVLWGVLFAMFLAGLRDEERHINRVPAMFYATGLWFGSSLLAGVMLGITRGVLEHF